MEILFLGGFFPKEMEEYILARSKSMVQYAANKFQWNLIDGFLNISGINLHAVSAPFVGPFPNEFRDFYIRGNSYLYKNSLQCQYVPFCNLWGYRNISRTISLKRAIEHFLSIKSRKKVIISYSLHTPFLQAAVFAKRIDPSIHLCLIVPDLAQFMNLSKKKTVIYNIFKKLDIKILEKSLKYVSSFVLLTEHMKDVLKVGSRPYIVIEGIVDDSYPTLVSEGQKTDETYKTVVYTGTLNEKFGVVNLIKAFHAIDDRNVRLKICGRGDSEDLIKKYALKDDRIQFLGQVSNEEAVRLQNNATVLVNPRQNNEDFTKYSFPSKNLEYLLAGKPVVAYKLDGIPDEYDKYFHYVEDNTIESLSNTIKKVVNLPYEEREKIGKAAREFVIKNKNKNVAAFKIYSMIKGASNDKYFLTENITYK